LARNLVGRSAHVGSNASRVAWTKRKFWHWSPTLRSAKSSLAIACRAALWRAEAQCVRGQIQVARESGWNDPKSEAPQYPMRRMKDVASREAGRMLKLLSFYGVSREFRFGPCACAVEGSGVCPSPAWMGPKRWNCLRFSIKPCQLEGCRSGTMLTNAFSFRKLHQQEKPCLWPQPR
jgi:hypothetical protein